MKHQPLEGTTSSGGGDFPSIAYWTLISSRKEIKPSTDRREAEVQPFRAMTFFLFS